MVDAPALAARAQVLRELRGDPAAEQERIAAALGLDARPGGRDEVVALSDSLGVQSSHFVVRSERWRGRGRCAPLDPVKRPSAFVKAVPRQSLIDAAKNDLASARARAEARARELGMGDSAVASAGDEAVAEAEAALANALMLVDEPSVQLERERDVLRAWAAAEAAGELRLPPDSLLVVPRLLEETGSSRELVLVMEDLCAAGFSAQPLINSLSLEDCFAVVRALADLHGALTRIRDRVFGGAAAAAAAALVRGRDSPLAVYRFERDLRNAIAHMRRGPPTPVIESESGVLLPNYDVDLAASLEPLVDEIVAAYRDEDAGPGPRVVSHGDPWAHNMMLRRDAAGSVTGVAFVDLGGVRFAHPGEDFFCFITSSTDMSVLGGKQTTELLKAFRQRQIENGLLPQDSTLFCLRSRFHCITTSLYWFLDIERWKQEGLYERRLYGVWEWAGRDAQLTLKAMSEGQPT
jgi:hypothetical protein